MNSLKTHSLCLSFTLSNTLSEPVLPKPVCATKIVTLWHIKESGDHSTSMRCFIVWYMCPGTSVSDYSQSVVVWLTDIFMDMLNTSLDTRGGGSEGGGGFSTFQNAQESFKTTYEHSILCEQHVFAHM